MRTVVWRENPGIWFARVPEVDIEAREIAHKAIQIALVARDLLDPGVEVRIKAVDADEDSTVFKTRDKFLPRYPQGYTPAKPPRRPGQFFIGEHVQIISNGEGCYHRHYFPVGDVVQVERFNYEYGDDIYTLRGTTWQHDTLYENYTNTVRAECMRLTDAPLTMRTDLDDLYDDDEDEF